MSVLLLCKQQQQRIRKTSQRKGSAECSGLLWLSLLSVVCFSFAVDKHSALADLYAKHSRNMALLSFVKKRLSSQSFSPLLIDSALLHGAGANSIAHKVPALKQQNEQPGWRSAACVQAFDACPLLSAQHTSNKLTDRVTSSKVPEDDSRFCMSRSSSVRPGGCSRLPSNASREPRRTCDQVELAAEPRTEVITSCLTPKHQSVQQDRRSKVQDVPQPALQPLSAEPQSESREVRVPSTGDKLVLRVVARNDNETFLPFFRPLASGGKVRLDDASFRAVEALASQRVLLGCRRQLRLNRNHRQTPNPVKSLARRIAATGQSYSELQPLQ